MVTNNRSLRRGGFARRSRRSGGAQSAVRVSLTGARFEGHRHPNLHMPAALGRIDRFQFAHDNRSGDEPEPTHLVHQANEQFVVTGS
jgi:hypothetical protein